MYFKTKGEIKLDIFSFLIDIPNTIYENFCNRKKNQKNKTTHKTLNQFKPLNLKPIYRKKWVRRNMLNDSIKMQSL